MSNTICNNYTTQLCGIDLDHRNGPADLSHQLCRCCVSSMDKVFCACDEVIKDVLLVVQRAGIPPRYSILPSTPAISTGIHQSCLVSCRVAILTIILVLSTVALKCTTINYQQQVYKVQHI